MSGAQTDAVTVGTVAVNSLRAFLFDLDGTLVDSVPDLTTAVNQLRRAWRFEPVSEERVRCWIGDGAHRLVERALASTTGGLLTETELGQAYTLFVDYYQRSICDRSTVYPGVLDLLENLSSRGYFFGVVTNKPRQFAELLLARLNLSGHFDVLVAGDDLPCMKPHPAMLVHACEVLGILTGQAAFVGDSRTDVAAARAARMPVLLAGWGYDPTAGEGNVMPDVILRDVRDIVLWVSPGIDR